MKVREWLDLQGPLGKELARRGGGLDYFTSILDAEVIGLPCPTCGGSKECPKCGGRGTLQVAPWSDAALREYGAAAPCGTCKGTGTCPDCPPPVVIAPEAMEAAAEAMYELMRQMKEARSLRTVQAFQQPLLPPWNELDEPSKHAFRLHARAALQALLPGARAAKEVGCIHDNSPGDPTFYLWTKGDAVDIDGYTLMAHDIAILKPAASKEEPHA